MATVNLTDKAVQAATAAEGQRLELWDALTPGLCLRVSDTGRKAFFYRYRTDDGRQPRMALGAYSRAFGLADARDEVERLRPIIRKGGDPAGERKQAKLAAKAQELRTLNDLADAFLVASESGEWRPRDKRKRERTIHDEIAILRRHIRPKLGDMRLEAIDRRTVRDLLRAMAARKIGAQTNRTHAVLRQVLAYGVAEERLTINPAAGLKPVAEETPRDRILTDDELKGLWATLQSPTGLRLPPKEGEKEGERVYLSRAVAIALQLAALLLQRRKEVAGMRLDELNLEQGIWTIAPDRMKGGVVQMVPLPDRAIELIREALALATFGREKAPPVVFPSRRDPSRAIHPDTLSHAMREAMAASGLKVASPHDLRRTGATNMASERVGVTPFVVSRVLGHMSETGGGAAVTLAHYNLHDYAPEKRKALEGWQDLLREIVGEVARPENVRRFGARGQ